MRRGGVVLIFAAAATGCSNLLVSPGASSDGSGMISYASDDGGLFGDLARYPAADHPANATRETYDWDSGAYLGEIPEAPHTYSVVGNMNEFGLAISETTFGGLSQLEGQKGLLSYGGLIWITLQREKTARGAISTMGELVAKYGYADTGESFSINDGKEVWIMELISKGPGEVGAVWVARKIPDGYVCAHANQARIRKFPRNDKDTIFSADVVDFARKKGLYPHDAADEDFSFSDVFDPLTFGGARFCEARVYSFFSAVAPGIKDEYLDYVSGRNLSHRMPLWVQPTLAGGAAHPGKLSLNETMWHFRNHYEDTWFDDRTDVGAGAFESAYRYSPLTYKVGNKSYVNERAISVQYTGWHFTAQVRPWLPPPVSGLLWFGPDDTKHSLNVPFYGGATRVPLAWTGEDCMGRSKCRRERHLPGTITDFSFNSAHWVFNMVSNYAYQRYDLVSPAITARIVATEAMWFNETKGIDLAAAALYKAGQVDDAVEMVTAYSYDTSAQAVKDWLSFWQELFVTYVDGFVTKPDKTNEVCECEKTAPGPGDKWYERIVNETGDHYEAIDPIPPHAATKKTRDKRELAGPVRRAKPRGRVQRV